jgi:hypothetical protein
MPLSLSDAWCAGVLCAVCGVLLFCDFYKKSERACVRERVFVLFLFLRGDDDELRVFFFVSAGTMVSEVRQPCIPLVVLITPKVSENHHATC